MLSSSTTQAVLERIADLPELLQDSLEPDILRGKLGVILEKYAVSSVDATRIENELVFILAAFEPYEDLSQNIAIATNIPQEKVANIAKDIDTAFLTPNIRASLDSIYDAREEIERSTAVRMWLESSAPSIVARTLISELHLNPEHAVLLVRVVDDTVLGLIPADALPSHIQTQTGMPLSLAQLVAEHLLILLAQAHALPMDMPPAPPAPPPAPPASEVPVVAPAPVATPPPPQTPPESIAVPAVPPAPAVMPPVAPAPAPPSPAAPIPQTPPPQPMQTPPAPTPVWASVQEVAQPPAPSPAPSYPPPQTPAAHTAPPQAPPPTYTAPPVPSYQKPLTSVPQYRNANLYQKPASEQGQSSYSPPQ